jgi:hypothetical protein
MLLIDCYLYQYAVTFFVSSEWFWLKICFFQYDYSYSCLLSNSICLEYHSLSFHFQSMYIFAGEVSFLQAASLGSYFLIQSCGLHLLIGELRPLIFRVIIERYIIFPVILLFFFWLFGIFYVYFSSLFFLKVWGLPKLIMFDSFLILIYI